MKSGDDDFWEAPPPVNRDGPAAQIEDQAPYEDSLSAPRRRSSLKGQTDLHKALASREWPSTLNLLGHHLSIGLAPSAAGGGPASWLTVSLDEDRCWLGLGPKLTAFLSRPFGQLPGDTDPVAALCAAFSLDTVLTALEGLACERCSVASWGRSKPAEAEVSILALDVTLDDGTSETATLHATEGAAARLVQAIATQPLRLPEDDGRPIVGQVSLARLILPTSHLQDLKTGSAILLGRSYSKRHHVVLRLGRRRASCLIDGGGLKIMSDFVDDVGDRMELAALPESSVIEVDVVLTSITMTLSELSTLSPGAIVDLPETIGQHVTLVVNDQPIGHGRVLDVNGALAAQIVDRLDGRV